MDDTVIADLSEARRRREDDQGAALLALYSGILGRPLVRRDLPPRQQLEREMLAEHRRQGRRERLATATGTT